MNALQQRIAALIAAQGPMPIAEYMTLALHDPSGGYYATHDPLGAAGDFITAPEVSQMFGELIGLWMAQTWMDQGSPARPTLVELGPGRGTLMHDALRALKLVPAFRSQVQVVLVENSAVLEGAQKRTLSALDVPIRSVTGFADVKTEGPMYLVANEFFDVLPIRQYVKKGGGWFERMVGTNADGTLRFVLSPVPLPAPPPNRDGAPEGGVYEQCSAGEALADEIAHRIAAHGGAALIIDYGYDTPGFGETLQAMKRHGPAEVLSNPGENDLTAHVDFCALGDAAVRGGASVCGPMPQGAWLKSLGIEQRAEALSAHARSGALLLDADRIWRGVERLIADDQMGELFKAIAIVPKNAPTPPGF
ncbi:MAG: SAM-dependent methyltransferase [Alphaproteobacteria bacterium]|nr:SAM-dependent methyltransferase [Alphaproteobacteria bacterium]MBL6938637.1 SAM-dependent methyltransferase [Alphaproteobacteria bacterium]MBL7098006.1 SAM-dependent methyltransferase [Alphaproteobacteria bacterium]